MSLILFFYFMKILFVLTINPWNGFDCRIGMNFKCTSASCWIGDTCWSWGEEYYLTGIYVYYENFTEKAFLSKYFYISKDLFKVNIKWLFPMPCLCLAMRQRKLGHKLGQKYISVSQQIGNIKNLERI